MAVWHVSRQLTGEVLWEQTIRQMVFDGVAWLRNPQGVLPHPIQKGGADFWTMAPMCNMRKHVKRLDEDASSYIFIVAELRIICVIFIFDLTTITDHHHTHHLQGEGLLRSRPVEAAEVND